MTVSTFHFIKAVVAGAAVGLVLLLWFVKRRRIRKGRTVLSAVLAVLALVAVLGYFDFGYYPKFSRFLNPHDLYHYYLGSKYSREVGYLQLYRCTVVADWENNGQGRQSSVRNMEDYSFTPVTAVIQDAARYKALFTKSRWREFRTDIRFFRALLGKRWETVVGDMGYNATPVWNMVGRVLTNAIPTSSPLGLGFLISLDLALITIMILLVQKAFGTETALFTVIFFGTCFCMSYTHIRGGFLRLDWVAMLVMSLSLLKMGRYKTAGALMGYSGMARIFPLAFVIGLGGKCLWDFLRTRTLNRKYLEFFGVFAVVCGALLAVSIWDDGGIQHWLEFKRKIALHNRHLAPVRVGFRNIFLMAYAYPSGGWPAYREAGLKTLEDWKFLLWAIQGAVLLLSLYLVRNLEDYETVAYGYVPVFFLTAPTFYYHVMLIAALFLFLPKRDRLPRALGVAGAFLISLILFIANRFLLLDLTLAFIMACLLMAFALFMMGTAFRAGPELAPAEAAPIAAESAPEGRESARGDAGKLPAGTRPRGGRGRPRRKR
jgi:hypothetical protein